MRWNDMAAKTLRNIACFSDAYPSMLHQQVESGHICSCSLVFRVFRANGG